MKKKLLYILIPAALFCGINSRVQAQDYGTEQYPCEPCAPPIDPCIDNNGNTNPCTPPLPNPPETVYTPPDTALPTGPSPCVANPCSCNPQSCGIPPTPSGCQSNPCSCNPTQCQPYTGPNPNPTVLHATVTVTPTLQSTGSTLEYITATAPQGSIFSYGPLAVVFAINPQTGILAGASGGGTTANPWNVISYIPASFGGSYTQAEVINTNAPEVINFTIVAQITIGGVTNTQTINVNYTQSTNSCTILLN